MYFPWCRCGFVAPPLPRRAKCARDVAAGGHGSWQFRAAVGPRGRAGNSAHGSFTALPARLTPAHHPVQRIVDLSKEKNNLLACFNEELREYVGVMLSEKILDATEDDRFEASLAACLPAGSALAHWGLPRMQSLLVRQWVCRPPREVDEIRGGRGPLQYAALCSFVTRTRHACRLGSTDDVHVEQVGHGARDGGQVARRLELRPGACTPARRCRRRRSAASCRCCQAYKLLSRSPDHILEARKALRGRCIACPALTLHPPLHARSCFPCWTMHCWE